MVYKVTRRWTLNSTPHRLKLLYRKSFTLPQFCHLCTVKPETFKTLWICTNLPATFLTKQQRRESEKVSLYVYVNVSIRKIILLDDVHLVCEYLCRSSPLCSPPLLSSLCRICLIISLSWRLLFLLIWRAAMCENLSGSFIWLLIYYIKVQSDIFELYKGGNKKHFDNLLHVLYQRVRPQKQPAVCLRIFQIKTTFLWSTAWRHLFPQT